MFSNIIRRLLVLTLAGLLAGCCLFDSTAPVINLIDDAAMTISVGGSFTDPGATAEDNCDGDISANIIVGGDTVDSTTPGTYTITYNVSDVAGNVAAEVSRVVTVVDVPYQPTKYKPTKTYWFDASGVLDLYVTYEYDTSGNLTRISDYYTSGDLGYHVTFEYDAGGKLTKMSRYDPLDVLDFYATYEYDTSGNLTTVSGYVASDALTGYFTYEYETGGNLTRMSDYDASGALTGYVTFEYDTGGKLTMVSSYDAPDVLDGYMTFEWTMGRLSFFHPSFPQNMPMEVNFIIGIAP